MKTGRYNIKQLLTNSEVDQIIIPEIQRDYVWKKQNVLGLLCSIYKHYQKKETLQLEIKCDGKSLSADVEKFLTDEYMRVRYNTQVGFIYAYHDSSYAGKLFLIDGQQRLTTLSLLLLAAYCENSNQDSKEAYKKNYFKDKLPKLDYKVREVSHDFMVSFIDYVSSSEGNSAFENSPYYYEIYKSDVTAQALLANYKVIVNYLNENGILSDSNRTKFIDYIENYVEFNYFDTNLSEQGERLYLYMNSRGEELSEQEKVRALLIGRSDKKLEDGKKWEDWQNFFWKNRGKNPNSDIGFESFIKMAAIIHLCKNGKGETKDSLDSKIFKFKEGDEELFHYLKETSSFNISWLETAYAAICKLAEFRPEREGYVVAGWLSNVESMKDYVTILGCIYYLIKYPESEALDVKRMGMHLKNICYYPANKKNPNTAVRIALESIEKMAKLENNIKDIADVKFDEIFKDSGSFYSESDKMKAKRYRTPERKKWEEIFWDIVNKDGLNKFIQGDASIILNLTKENEDPANVREAVSLFESKIYNCRNNQQLRVDLLKYGDYSLDDRGGSDTLGEWMGRYNFVENDDDWLDLLSAKVKDENERIRLMEIREKVIKPYLYSDNPGVNDREWTNFIIDYDGLGYMQRHKFLWKEYPGTDVQPHVILLSGHQASKFSSRELAIQILHKKLAGSWVLNYQTCVIELDIDGDAIRVAEQGNMGYYLEIIYHWNKVQAFWSLCLGHREKQLGENLLHAFREETLYKWECSKDGKLEVASFYPGDNVVVKENEEKATENVIAAIDKLLPQLYKILKYLSQ